MTTRFIRIQTHSFIFSRRTEAECPNRLATETLLKLKERKSIDTQSNDVTTVQKIMNELLKHKYRLYMYSSSLMKYTLEIKD